MKIGDIFATLGLKNDAFIKGVDQAEKKAQGMKASFAKIGSALSGFFVAAGIAVAGALAKAALDTDKFGDRFKRMTSGLKSTWDTFTNSLMNWDWEGFWDRVRGANKAGRELYDVEDSLYEASKALELRRSQLEKENEELRIAANDQTKTLAERNAAAQKYIDNLRPIYAEEERLARQHRVALENNLLATKGVGVAQTDENRGKLETFLLNGAQIPLGQEWDAAYIGIAKGFATMSQAAKDKLYDVIQASNEAAGALERDNRRMFSSLNSTAAQITGTIQDVGEESIWDHSIVELLRADMLVDEVEMALNPVKDIIADAFTAPDASLAGWDAYQNALEDKAENMTAYLEDFTERVKELSEEFGKAVATGFSDAVGELTDALFGLQEMDGGQVVAALLTPLADMVTQMGELIMAAGVAELGLLDALMHPTPATAGIAIAAGAALIAVGQLAKSGLAALAQGGGAAGATSTYSGGSSSAGNGTIATELTVNVKGTIKGSDIVLSGQRTLNQWSR